MDYLFQDGGKPRNTKSKTGSKTKSSSKTGTKSSTKTSSRTTKSKSSSKKGGNFLGAVGDLVAPTGWGPFATAAGLLALDRADAALRRGKSEKSSEKSSAKKGGMRGGNDEKIKKLLSEYKEYLSKINYNKFSAGILFSHLTDTELELRQELRRELNSSLNSNKKEQIITDMIKKAQEDVKFEPIEKYIAEFKNSYKKYKHGNNSNNNYEQKFREVLFDKFKMKPKEIDDYVIKFKSVVDNPY